MLRLAGLPPVERAPRVGVSLEDDRLVLRFARVDGGATRLDAPLFALGDEVDGEEAQLRLLARLTELGYAAVAVAPG